MAVATSNRNQLEDWSRYLMASEVRIEVVLAARRGQQSCFNIIAGHHRKYCLNIAMQNFRIFLCIFFAAF